MPKGKTSKNVIADIKRDVDNSTIPMLLKALYYLADSVSIIDSQCYERLKGVYARHGVYTNENELLKGINDYCKTEKMAVRQFFHNIEPTIIESTFDFGDKTGVDGYDSFHSNASNIVFLVLMIIDRCCDDLDAYTEIVQFIHDLPSKGIYTEDDFERFRR